MKQTPTNLYGCWRRLIDRSELDPFELRQRDDEEAWDLRNEALADQLDEMVGKIARLTVSTPIGHHFCKRGTRFRVVWRVKDWLIISWLRDPSVLQIVEAAKFELEPRSAVPAERVTAVHPPLSPEKEQELADILNAAVNAASIPE